MLGGKVNIELCVSGRPGSHTNPTVFYSILFVTLQNNGINAKY